jgi:hypothetical protein
LQSKTLHRAPEKDGITFPERHSLIRDKFGKQRKPSFGTIPASDFHGIARFPEGNLRGHRGQSGDCGLQVCRGGFH